MNQKSKTWLLQEWGMVRRRWLLTYVPLLSGGYSGNPMTLAEGIKHMLRAWRYTKQNPALYT